MTKKPNIAVLIGTKAQFIKTAPILREFDRRAIAYDLTYTGQHSETFDLLELAFGTRSPDDVLVPNFEASTHGGFLRWSLTFLFAALRRIRGGRWRGIRFGLVHGDTASTLFSAIVLRIAGVRVAHVEAGLRSPRLFEPFPEEIVRRLVSKLSLIHFAPDSQAVANLSGVGGQIINSGGNTLRDALALAMNKWPDMPQEGGGGGYGIVSIHRSENLTSRDTFEMLMEEVISASLHVPIKFVLHPATRERIRRSSWEQRFAAQPGLQLMNRMDYPDFVRLLVGSSFIMTDGGSNQEESAMLGLPTLLLRRATERPDGLGDNVVLSGLERAAIGSFVMNNVGKRWVVRLQQLESPSSIIVDALMQLCGRRK